MVHDFPVDVSGSNRFLLKLLAVVLETVESLESVGFHGGLGQYLVYAVEELGEVRLVAAT